MFLTLEVYPIICASKGSIDALIEIILMLVFLFHLAHKLQFTHFPLTIT